MSDQIVRERCVVLMGKTGAGKSSIANHLVGYDPLSSSEPSFNVPKKVLQSATREVKHEVVKIERDGVEYVVTVIDTIGLFDTSVNGNDPVFAKIEGYFNDHIKAVNLILFVYKKGRCTKEEHEVFSFIREKFHAEISPISAIAVTGCESDTAETRVALVKEFHEDPATKEIASQMTLGIYPVGFPPLKSFKERFRPLYKEQMEEDRECLMDLIVKADNPHLTKKLFVEKVKKKLAPPNPVPVTPKRPNPAPVRWSVTPRRPNPAPVPKSPDPAQVPKSPDPAPAKSSRCTIL